METEAVKGHAAMGVAAVIWGLMSPICKLTMQTGAVSAVSLASFRLLGAGILFWIASFFVPHEHVEKKDKFKLFLAALFGVVFNQMLFVVGVKETSPADASIITTVTPILTMVLASFVLKERLTGIKVTGVCSCAIGAILLISGSAHTSPSSGENNLLGDILCLTSQCSVAIYFVFFKDVIAKYALITLLKWMFGFASCVCLPFTTQDILAVPYELLSPQLWLGCLYVVIMATFVAYILLSYAQQRITPTAVSMYNYSQPIIASSLSVFWGMDHFGVLKTVSIILVFLGVFLVSRSGKMSVARD